MATETRRDSAHKVHMDTPNNINDWEKPGIGDVLVTITNKIANKFPFNLFRENLVTRY